MKTNKKAAKKGVNQEVINTQPTPPTQVKEGIGQDVINNVPTPPTAATPTVSVADAMQFLMTIMQQGAGGEIIVRKEGAEISIPVPKNIKPKNLAKPMVAPTDGVNVASFTRVTTANPADVFPFLQGSQERLITFQNLSNQIKNASILRFSVNANSEVDTGINPTGLMQVTALHGLAFASVGIFSLNSKVIFPLCESVIKFTRTEGYLCVYKKSNYVDVTIENLTGEHQNIQLVLL